MKGTNKTISLGDLGISYMFHVDSGIRRCGFINKDKLPAFPRMHNKFIVLGNDKLITEDVSDYNFLARQYTEVITGSFNYTENSTNSLENIICIKDNKIVEAYYRQFGEIALISVELDWSGDWNPDESNLRYGS
jgi:phosphatidylserine/phosphatidylglycerophosphate/cardiolipin synthase-like enzyme